MAGAVRPGGADGRPQRRLRERSPVSRLRRTGSESGLLPQRGDRELSGVIDDIADADGCCYECTIGLLCAITVQATGKAKKGGEMEEEAMTKLGMQCRDVIVTCILGIKQHWRSRSREMLIRPLFLPHTY